MVLEQVVCVINSKNRPMSTTQNTLPTDGTNTIIDTNSALYMHPSDSPGIMLVPVRFDGAGYRSWRRGVLRALSVKSKLGFIDGSWGKPDVNSPQFRQWQRCDHMVTSWILNSLNKRQCEYVNNSVEL